ncbi:MAG: ChbG/HpnK family deacetylase [Patescibacteria group bacterium]
MRNFARKKLIISADDFGKSRTVDENILSLVRAGRIDRVAILIDGDIKDAEVAELLNSGVKLDIHLNLKKFKARPDEPRSVFTRGVLFLWYYFLKNNTNIREEWEAQVEKFISAFGRKPDGLNSHQYIHFFPPYFSAALELADEYKISYFRFGKIGISKNMNYVSAILRWLRKKDVPGFEKFSFDSSDFLASYDWVKNFPRFLEELPPGKTELVFHPEREEEFEAINKYFRN